MRIYNPLYGWREVYTENTPGLTNTPSRTFGTNPTTVFIYTNKGGTMGGNLFSRFEKYVANRIGWKYIKGKTPTGVHGQTALYAYIDEPYAQELVHSFLQQNPPSQQANYSLESQTSIPNDQGQHQTQMGKTNTPMGGGNIYR